MATVSKYTRVLTSSGYKNITDIRTSDIVYSANMKPTKVVSLEEIKLSDPIIEIKYQNWYVPLYCTPNTKLLVCESIDSPYSVKFVDSTKVKSGSYTVCLENIYKMLYSMQNNISLSSILVYFSEAVQNSWNSSISQNINPEKIKTDIGYLIGLYCGYGSTFVKTDIDNKSTSIHNIVFRLGPNSDLCDKIHEMLNYYLDAKCNVEIVESNYIITLDSPNAASFFNLFGSHENKNIPEVLRINDIDYVKGIFGGLSDNINNVSRFIAPNRELAEVYVWICAILGAAFEHNHKLSFDAASENQNNRDIWAMYVKHRQPDALNKVDYVRNVDSRGKSNVFYKLNVENPDEGIIMNNAVVSFVEK